MNADGQKGASSAIINDQKKCRKDMSRNSVRLNCTRTMKNRVLLSAISASPKRRFFLFVGMMPKL